jgi:hypothetical protein
MKAVVLSKEQFVTDASGKRLFDGGIGQKLALVAGFTKPERPCCVNTGSVQTP